MNKSLCIAIVIGGLSQGSFGATGSSGKGSGQASAQSSQGSSTKRVRANTQGFDLNPKSGGGTQLGAGSRGGEPAKIVLYAPNLGLAYSLHPTFQWKPSPGNLTFRLNDSDGNEVWEGDVTGKNSYVYPQDAPSLKAGQTYSWTVQGKALAMTEPVSAQVRIVAGADRQRLDAGLKKIAGDSAKQKIERAELFADNRVWYDAVAAYSQLIAENPNDAKAYQARAEIYESLPQTKGLAAEDTAKAGK